MLEFRSVTPVSVTHDNSLQETLIVWSENDTTELALSFQERAGCDEIWAKICQVRLTEIILLDNWSCLLLLFYFYH